MSMYVTKREGPPYMSACLLTEISPNIMSFSPESVGVQSVLMHDALHTAVDHKIQLHSLHV